MHVMKTQVVNFVFPEEGGEIFDIRYASQEIKP
jgi:hypothetical protein